MPKEENLMRIVVVLRVVLSHYPAQAQKNKKQVHPEKALISKKFLYFLKRKLFLNSLKWNPALCAPIPRYPSQEKFLRLQEVTSNAWKLKVFYTFFIKKQSFLN